MADVLETTAVEVPAAATAPPAPPVPSDVASELLAGVGISPFDPDDPQAPVESPALLAMLALARRRADEGLSTFGRMFPVGEGPNALQPLNQLTEQQLADLAQTMLEEEPIDNPKGTAAGLTFFGQFIDHDMTLDETPQPSEAVDVDSILNERTFSFDLDSVYGGNPKKSPQLYDGDKFLIGTATDGVSPDLPRDENGVAIIGDARNDENLIVSQIHLSFLRLHNALVDDGMSFDKAKKTVVGAYQHVVLNDYLPQIVGQQAVDNALGQSISGGFYQPGSKDAAINPVEFSTAAFRFGHSQVRNGYAINDTAGGLVFSPNPEIPDLRGGRQLPATFVIDFNNFFGELPRDSEENPAQVGMAIDTKISQSLFQIPIPGAAGSGSNVLAFRNMVRGKFYHLPSGEAIAEAMGVPVVGEPVFEEGTPLWYYVLREAELTSAGAELGPVGGAIVAEVFIDLLRMDTAVRNDGDPRLPDVSGGDFQIGDLLVAADQLEAGEPPSQGPKPRPERDKRFKNDRAKERREQKRERAERRAATKRSRL